MRAVSSQKLASTIYCIAHPAVLSPAVFDMGVLVSAAGIPGDTVSDERVWRLAVSAPSHRGPASPLLAAAPLPALACRASCWAVPPIPTVDGRREHGNRPVHRSRAAECVRQAGNARPDSRESGHRGASRHRPTDRRRPALLGPSSLPFPPSDLTLPSEPLASRHSFSAVQFLLSPVSCLLTHIRALHLFMLHALVLLNSFSPLSSSSEVSCPSSPPPAIPSLIFRALHCFCPWTVSWCLGWAAAAGF